MIPYDSILWRSDLEVAIKHFSLFDVLDKKSLLVTGASGLICSGIIDILIFYNETQKANITIFAAGRSKERIQARFGEYFSREYFHFVPYDATDYKPLCLPNQIDYIIHGAGISMPDKYVKEPVETMSSNILGLLSLFHLARKNETQRILYISSSEVYGKKNKDDISPFSEDSYGFIDCLNPRNSYPIAKSAAEAMCVACTNEYGIESTIVRPGHIYGPTASPQDTRVSAMWSYAAAHGNDIVMKSDGAQIRSYCYCLDCATAILTVLIKGKNKEAYNISNKNSVITIRELGELISEIAGVKLVREAATSEDKKAFNPMDNSSLASPKLEKLGWEGLFDARTGIEHTIKILKDIADDEQ